jgi:hypothetical protein
MAPFTPSAYRGGFQAVLRLNTLLRVAIILIVVLTSVIALFAGAHWRRLDADAGPVAMTEAHPPERDEHLNRQKAFAMIILMLKEGRSAR